MTKQKILILIPLALIAVILTYCWAVILTTEILATWRHYSGLIFFIGIIFLFFKSMDNAIIATGFFLLFTTFNLLTLTPEIRTSQFRIGPIYTPEFNLLSTGLFILYFSLNLDKLIDIYLDYKEAKEIKTKKN